jgi:hypothetical protein
MKIKNIAGYMILIWSAISAGCVTGPVTWDQWNRCEDICIDNGGTGAAKTLWDGRECCECSDGTVIKKAYQD